MSLFRRLTNPGSLAAMGDGDLQEIIDNLNNILNTKKDYGAPLGNLGMSDLSAYTSKSDIGLKIIEEIRDNVARFEPRIEVVEIEQLDNDNPMYLSFRLHCRMRNRKEEMEVIFDSRNKWFNLDRVSS